ncbi:hypothetical protein GLYMA_12G236500v4 [Glycine max]|uniref:Uncharacterized protein n=2 Tax=Glycine max TaxID=3847 RepID=K7LWL6_SOYBN|nr:probable disease resistance protein At1g61300 isoform X1 [Glycine max]KAH1144636.1 hypothetical protein GYH30_034729 [Glycine max]KAH1222976.1 putative disease resistance protein [Glycine max]KRH27463.1 hypothetical protein GLYMA_12G236500v4 [Glycine max]|eukprot:XP_006592960.1 probable disease resistance protein At1g61300 isoform X1 [Glycine max]
MGRPRGDEKYWNEVTSFEENGKQKWKCKHCEKTYGGGYSRIKLHLDKEQKGQGITKCPVYCSNEEVLNIIASTSIHPQETVNTLNPLQVVEDVVAGEMIVPVGAPINHQTNNESTSLFEGWAPEHAIVGSNNSNGIFQSKISVINELVSDLSREEDDIKEQLEWLESRGKKRKGDVDDWMDELRDLKKHVADVDWLGFTNFYASDLVDKLRKHKIDKPLVLSNEFVGEQFELNVGKMWKLLVDDQVFVIGINGMGGVGKTFLATYMENEIKRKGSFRHVFWVTVSHDFTTFKLQHQIAKKIGVKLDGDDERCRATILSSELEKIENSVLILDDVWRYIDLQKVGIPLKVNGKVNGIKLIMTSRLKHVCRQMDCLPDNTIQIYPLKKEEDEEEDWELFLLKLGHHGTPATLPPQVVEIARSVVRKCDGLPLAINVMARTMKGCYDTIMWKHELNKLENLEMGEEVKEEVFTVLKRSYDNLIEKDLQKYLLYFAQIPNNSGFQSKSYLVKKLVESGLLKNVKRSLREVFDEACAMANKLVDHSLFVGYDYHTKMHGLVRNMACRILNESNNYMVKCEGNLSEIPDVKEWIVDLEVVSLGGNRIKEIPEGISPNCPRLSTLILSGNCIGHIPEGFFIHMNALTVLNISYNDFLTSLPHSLSNLRSLVSLVLQNCSNLEYIPPLGELQALSRLDISGCSIRQVPEGLKNLINLKWLDMSINEHLTLAPRCVLPGLTNLQYLDLRCDSAIIAEDVQGMSMLECFGGIFLGKDNYNSYVQEILDRGHGPKTYDIHVEDVRDLIFAFDIDDPVSLYEDHQNVRFWQCEGLLYLLPRDLKKLSMERNDQWVCLCGALSSSGPLSSLNQIDIIGGCKLKSLFCLSSSCSLCTNIQNLQVLNIYGLDSFTAICEEDAVDLTRSLSPRGVFSNLKKFQLSQCHEIETLLTPLLVPQLQNLEVLSVESCRSMREIFAVSNSGNDDNFNIILPKLIRLRLWNLPELTTVCREILVCGSADILFINHCPKLERLPRIVVYD